jgi:hypothetical protein
MKHERDKTLKQKEKKRNYKYNHGVEYRQTMESIVRAAWSIVGRSCPKQQVAGQSEFSPEH